MSNKIPDQNIGTARLDHYRVLIISGPDRAEFLQGQLTQDVTTLESAGTALAGWTSAKGRLLAAGQLIAVGDEIWWPMPAGIVQGVAKRLQMFVLRAGVKIVISAKPVVGLFGIDAHEYLQISGESITLDNQVDRLADGTIIVRVIGDSDRAWLIGSEIGVDESIPVDEEAWVLESIRTGLPAIVADTQELFVPQMLNLDLIDAISFNKGCYVGQEIVARTQNLGRIKRRMYRFTSDTPATLSPGAHIYGAGNATGKVVLSSEEKIPGELLAVVPIESAGGPWHADELRSIELTRRPLPYRIDE